MDAELGSLFGPVALETFGQLEVIGVSVRVR